jgi:hypothetical protein
MEHENASAHEADSAVTAIDDQQARDREALRRRVRESLLRCPDPNLSSRG